MLHHNVILVQLTYYTIENMKRTIILAFLLIINYLFVIAQESQKDINRLIEFTVNISDTVNSNNEKGTPIILLVKNLSEEQMSISNPCHWSNSTPFIRYKGQMIPMIKVKADLSHINDFVIIQPNSICKVKFDYDLDQLFNLKTYSNRESLEIFFVFYGDIKLSNGINKCQISSNVVKFYIR